MTSSKHITIVGCGIVKNELARLIAQNRWNVSTRFACSSLHVDFDRLFDGLEKMLQNSVDEEYVLVLYGTCHPLIDAVVGRFNAARVPVQNCIELLLGKDIFTRELEAGAFFLLEDWAKRWDYVTRPVFGDRQEDEKIIFQNSHQYLLALRTPTSADFTASAQLVSKKTGLPLRWMDVELDVMEQYLQKAIDGLLDRRMN